MKIKKGQQLELTVSKLAFGGRGIAKVDGLTIFVDQAVPGDVVSVRIAKRKKKFAEARIIEILQNSPQRITPPCPYHGFCGGCKWQFLPYEQQLMYKRQHVQEALEHIGLLEGVNVDDVLPSPREYAYRNKMEFSCSDRKWLLPEEMGREDIDAGFALGLHVPGTYYKVLDTHACLLQPSLGNSILQDVRSHMKNSPAPVYGLKSHDGYWRFLMLRHSSAYDQWMVNVVTAAEDLAEVRPLAESLTRKYPQIVSVVNNVTARKAGIAVGEREILLKGQSAIRDKIGPFEFEISSNSFFQTNTTGAALLYQKVKEFAALTGRETVLDLYCGTGTIAICLSELAQEIIGIEIVPGAIADAQRNCQLNHISNCRFIHGDMKDCLPEVTTVPDVLVVDPPRAGMHQAVVKQILQMAPERIVYVSCNPATMARDISMLKDAYQLIEVQPVDMFPHTYHIESVARLEKLKRT
jgi:23S rRNA (uracil1939-C5)-methyltransferase